MEALILDTANKTAIVKSDLSIPSLAPNEVLVLVHAIALNPVDALYTFNPLGQSGRIVGTDFAGTIEKLGPDVPSASKLSRGTRVAGFVQGACSVNDRPGAAADYVAIPYDLIWRVPDDMDLKEAATISLCGLTAAQGLFYRLNMPSPFPWAAPNSPEPQPDPVNVFIYGASTSLGMYAVQLVYLAARENGFRIRLIGAASKIRHEMLKSDFGYHDLVDYRDEDWAEQVRKLVGKYGIHYAIDTISEGDSVEKVNSTLGDEGKQAIFRSRAAGVWKEEKPFKVEPIYGAVWEGLGAEIKYQAFTVPVSERARAFAVAFYKFLSAMSEGSELKLEPNPIRLMPGGLDRVVPDGFALLGPGKMEDRGRAGKEPFMVPISAEKLVYSLVEE